MKKPANVEAGSRPPMMAAATVFVEAEDLKRIRTSLAADGVEVIHTAGLDEAIQTPAPVILLDADGNQPWASSLRQVLEMRPTALVIVLARQADNRMWADVLSQGAHDLLLKPLVTSEVRSTVLGALRRERHASVSAAVSVAAS